MTGFKKWWNWQGWAFIDDTELREHGRACANLAWIHQEQRLVIATEALKWVAEMPDIGIEARKCAEEALAKIGELK